MARSARHNLIVLGVASAIMLAPTAQAAPVLNGADPASGAQGPDHNVTIEDQARLDPAGETTASLAPVYDENTGRAHVMSSVTADAAIAAYWTEERIESAIPLETPTLSASDQQQIVNQSTQDAKNARAEVVSTPSGPVVSLMGVQPATVTNWSHTNGKVLFRNASDGKNYICSGSALNSGSKRLVATAGHCVHGGKGKGWHQNWVFIPGYDKGSAPHGKFTAYTMRTMNDWINYGPEWRGFNSDVAFVTTNSSSTGKGLVVNAVGGHGLITGGSEYAWSTDMFGYPGNLQSGQVMYACSGGTGKWSASGYSFSRITGCGFGGGSSGGPWLKSYNNSSGQGLLKSVTSWNTDGVKWLGAPFFREDVRTMYTSANNDW
ncbi:peptidase [Oerskovia sp. KBS0722]|nr:peptidase [Oerskovia sp. KBS0722]